LFALPGIHHLDEPDDQTAQKSQSSRLLQVSRASNKQHLRGCQTEFIRNVKLPVSLSPAHELQLRSGKAAFSDMNDGFHP
jgi:hypothetical protein